LILAQSHGIKDISFGALAMHFSKRDGSAQAGRTRVLAVASGGGHWEQMMLLRPALEQFDVTFATTDAGLAEREGLVEVLVLRDTNRDKPLDGLRCAWDAIRAVATVRPEVVITTGALPGLIVLIAARGRRARTIWIDSVANSEKPSLSGRFARSFASLWLTQWEHLAHCPNEYAGGLL
jgi:UDP-N-acetylglucosamine:LPS N-acetylglucosamine transferase